MCVNEQNTTQAEVDEVLQFLTQAQATPLKKLLAAITMQAHTEGGICVAIANLPEELAHGQRPAPGPVPGGPAPSGPGIFPTVWEQPDKSIEKDDDGKDDGQNGMYL